MDWFFWRVYTAPEFKDTLKALEEDWSLDDVLTFHQVLDALDEARMRAREEAQHV